MVSTRSVYYRGAVTYPTTRVLDQNPTFLVWLDFIKRAPQHLLGEKNCVFSGVRLNSAVSLPGEVWTMDDDSQSGLLTFFPVILAPKKRSSISLLFKVAGAEQELSSYQLHFHLNSKDWGFFQSLVAPGGA